MLEAFYAANRERLGAAIGASDCHFGSHDIGRVVTQYEGDFRTAVLQGATTPLRRARHRVPTGMAMRQQWRALVALPIRRRRDRL